MNPTGEAIKKSTKYFKNKCFLDNKLIILNTFPYFYFIEPELCLRRATGIEGTGTLL